MRRLFLPAAILVACAREAPQENVLAEDAAGAPRSPSGTGQPDRLHDERAPVEEQAMDRKGAQTAAQVLRRYFALVGAGDDAAAASLWWDSAEARKFAARLKRYGDFETNIAAPQPVRGAAGSLYTDVSLQLLRKTSSGLESLSDGTAVLRRANTVPGSTAGQRQWRIHRITLQPPPVPLPTGYRFVGRWATEARNCRDLAWRFTATALTTPAGSQCSFRKVTDVPGGYDIAARCTSEGPPVDDLLKLRFAQSARAMLFESGSIADAGLERC